VTRALMREAGVSLSPRGGEAMEHPHRCVIAQRVFAAS
jgi:hypothetical protein